jgi:hypothetical protein
MNKPTAQYNPPRPTGLPRGTGLGQATPPMNARERLASLNRARGALDIAHTQVARTPDPSGTHREPILTAITVLEDALTAWADIERERLA